MNPIQQVRSWLEQRRIRAEMRSVAGGGAVPAAPVLSGTFVTPETAIGLTAVYCALNVISGDVACLPRHVYKTLKGGGLEIESDHSAEWLLGAGDPNEDMGNFRYLQTEMGHVLGRGNGYSEIVRENGFPVGLEPLHPVKTLPKRTKAGKLYYLLDNKRELLAEDVLHFAGLGFDGVSGYSAITLCRQSLGVTIATEQHGAAFFGNGAIMGGVLKHPRRLGEAAQSNLRKTINQVHQGTQSAYNLLILEEGMDYQDRGISPEDSQFIEGRQFGVLEVARMFRCPPHKLGDYSQAHLANVEESNLDYLATTILTWVTMLDDEATRKLLTRKERQAGLVVLTDLRALLRGNTATRTAYYQVMRNMGAMSANDIRIAEGANPLPAGRGGDLYVVQGQYVPLEKVGETPVFPAQPPPKAEKSGRDRGKGRQSERPTKRRCGFNGATVPPGSSLARRMNENHDEAGRFAEGDSSKNGEYENHPDVQDLKAGHEIEIKDLHADYDQQQKDADKELVKDHKDLTRDQAKEAKQLDKDQAKEAAQLDKDQAREVKELARDQEKERAELEQDPTATAQDKVDLADEHKDAQDRLAEEHQNDRENLEQDHKEAKEDLAKAHEDQHKDLDEAHADAKASLEQDRKDAIEALQRDHKDELAETIQGIKDDEESEE